MITRQDRADAARLRRREKARRPTLTVPQYDFRAAVQRERRKLERDPRYMARLRARFDELMADGGAPSGESQA